MKYPSTNKPELWQSAIEFYRELIDEDGWNQEPMLELVRWLSATEYSRWFYPSTSLHTLCISTVGTYPERYDLPVLSVVYESDHKHFVINYQNQHSRSLAKVQCQPEQVETALSALLLRFKMETATESTANEQAAATDALYGEKS
jgi:retron-type reverse transcriptase